jgi:uncharacterized membrane protein
MKKSLVVVMVMLFSGMAVSVQAANVAFNPGAVALNIEAGQSAVVNLVANASSNSRYYVITLQVGSTVEQGNLPQSWLNPANVSLNSITGGSISKSLNLEVNVPAGTPGGKYSAVVKPQVVKASEEVVTSDFIVEVEVPSEISCDGAPVLEDVQVGPRNIWAPTEKEVEIDISGTVIVAPGCEVAGTYTMDSNGGDVSGELAIDEAGNFAVKIPIKVAKDAKAKEGTIYNGMLSVVDVLGNRTSQEFFVQVDHNQGK